MNRALAILGAVSLLMTASCNLVAGLDQFHRASSSSAGGATSGASTTITSASTSGVTSSSSRMSSTSKSATVGSSSSGSPVCADHVLINEIDLQDDWVELYNPTTNLIQLANYSLEAHGSSTTALVSKWTGKSGDQISPGGYFVLGVGGDAPLTSSLSKTADPMVVVLYDDASMRADSACVCGPNCSMDAAVTSFCDYPAMLPALFDASPVRSVGRTSCADTKRTVNDFALDCPTLGMQNKTPATTGVACP